MTGKSLQQLDQAAGGHRIQRVPPTEKRGRVHTSTVTVAVLDDLVREEVILNDSDIRIEWFSGSGKGGQRRNKVKTSCRATHVPSGMVETCQSRSRVNSQRIAIGRLTERLSKMTNGKQNHIENVIRKSQVGSGMRGDKTVTIRFQDNRVQHHVTGKSMKANKYMKGFMNELWV